MKKPKTPTYIENLRECMDGVMEQFRLLRKGEGDIPRASVMTRQLTSVVSVGNLAAKYQKFGHAPGEFLGLTEPKEMKKVSEKNP